MAKRRSQLDPAIHRIPVENIRIFEITEAELEALEQGSPTSIFLNLYFVFSHTVYCDHRK